MALEAARSQLLVRMLRHHESLEGQDANYAQSQNKGWWRR